MALFEGHFVYCSRHGEYQALGRRSLALPREVLNPGLKLRGNSEGLPRLYQA